MRHEAPNGETELFSCEAWGRFSSLPFHRPEDLHYYWVQPYEYFSKISYRPGDWSVLGSGTWGRQQNLLSRVSLINITLPCSNEGSSVLFEGLLHIQSFALRTTTFQKTTLEWSTFWIIFWQLSTFLQKILALKTPNKYYQGHYDYWGSTPSLGTRSLKP